jgi:hypothetical protein
MPILFFAPCPCSVIVFAKSDKAWYTEQAIGVNGRNQ